MVGAGVDQTIESTSFDKPSQITNQTCNSSISNDHQRRRWRQDRISPTGSKTCYYLEGL